MDSKLLQSVEKLLLQRQFQSVIPNRDQVYGKYRITGANARWNKDSNTVYSYHLRITGSQDEVVNMINALTEEQLSQFREKINPHEEKYPFPGSKKTLIDTLITKNNHNVQKESETYTPYQLYQHEKEKYSDYLLRLREEERNAPAVDEIYQAFLEYKKNQEPSVPGISKTLRMDNLGEIYTGMTSGQLLNVFGYGNKNGTAEPITIDNSASEVYNIQGKDLYRVPNYPIISARKVDLEYAIKDLSRQGAIEMTSAELKKVLNSWMEVKKSHSKK